MVLPDLCRRRLISSFPTQTANNESVTFPRFRFQPRPQRPPDLALALSSFDFR